MFRFIGSPFSATRVRLRIASAAQPVVFPFTGTRMAISSYTDTRLPINGEVVRCRERQDFDALNSRYRPQNIGKRGARRHRRSRPGARKRLSAASKPGGARCPRNEQAAVMRRRQQRWCASAHSDTGQSDTQCNRASRSPEAKVEVLAAAEHHRMVRRRRPPPYGRVVPSPISPRSSSC